MSALVKLLAARTKFKAAEEELAKAVERAYPVGAVVSATIGRARVRGPVTGHGGTGYHLGYISITNDETGAERWFYAAERTLHNVTIESLPVELPQSARVTDPAADPPGRADQA